MQEEYLILFGVPDEEGNIFIKGSIKGIDIHHLKEDSKGVYLPKSEP